MPLYLTEEDVPHLLSILGGEVAFVIAYGPRRCKAIRNPGTTLGVRICIWHLASGPLPLLRAEHTSPDGEVYDPWSGWTEERTGIDPSTPYFGPGHPGIFWLNLRLSGRKPGSVCGLSSLEWIGNHYAILGHHAPNVTRKWWNKLRQRVARISEKVPRGGLAMLGMPEVWAFPNAFQRLRIGAPADDNP